MYGEYITDPLIGTVFLDLRVDANWRSKMLLQPNPSIAAQIPVFASGLPCTSEAARFQRARAYGLDVSCRF